MRGDHKDFAVPAHQADAVLSQANPVSGTKYTVLDTTKNVRIISIAAMITWATTQPTPLEVHITIDGVAITVSKTDPVTATPYEVANKSPESAGLVFTSATQEYRGLGILEGRSVKIEVEITWSTTQPTPLFCRVKYAKW